MSTMKCKYIYASLKHKIHCKALSLRKKSFMPGSSDEETIDGNLGAVTKRTDKLRHCLRKTLLCMCYSSSYKVDSTCEMSGDQTLPYEYCNKGYECDSDLQTCHRPEVGILTLDIGIDPVWLARKQLDRTPLKQDFKISYRLERGVDANTDNGIGAVPLVNPSSELLYRTAKFSTSELTNCGRSEAESRCVRLRRGCVNMGYAVSSSTLLPDAPELTDNVDTSSSSSSSSPSSPSASSSSAPKSSTLTSSLSVLPGKMSTIKSQYFVLVVAGEFEDRNLALVEQLSLLKQKLTEAKVPHVIVSSANIWPIVKLGRHMIELLPKLIKNDESCIEPFVQACLKKASKILLMISPGYWRYADKFAKWANPSSSTDVQALVRTCHKTIKDEWFNRRAKTNRILPVRLRKFNTNAIHTPSFLSKAEFYLFPVENNDCDVVALLMKEMRRDRARLKNSV